MRAAALLLLCWTAVLDAAPAIGPAAVMNAASLLPPGLPGGGVAPGSLFVIRGTQLGPGRTVTSAEPVGELGGVSVRIAVGRGAWQAGLLNAGDTEIRAIVPPEVTPGPATIAVEYQGRPSPPLYTRVVPASAGIFTVLASGSGPVSNRVFRRGEEVTLRITGLGAPDRSPPELEVFLGGTRITDTTVAREVECCGIDTVTFPIPDGAPAGCDVPVQLRMNRTIPSNTASISIAPLAQYCYEVDQVREAVNSGGVAGFAIPFRLSMDHRTDSGQSVQTVGDALVAGFREGVAGLGTNQLLHPPPPGACTLFTSAAGVGDIEEGVRRSLLAGSVVRDGGDFDVWIGEGPRQTVERQPVEQDYEYGLLGGAMPDRLYGRDPLFLRPGPVSIAARGGADVSPFEIRVRFPEPIVWTNRAAARTVNRNRDLEVHWDLHDPSQLVAVAGLSMDVARKAAGAFLCVASPGARSFRVPVPILQSLPATGTRIENSIGYLLVGTLPGDGRILFSAGELAEMLGVGVSVDGRSVRYR